MPLERTRLQRYTFLVLFAAALYAFWRTIEPIWVPLLMGMVVAVGAHPLQDRLLRRLRGRRPGVIAAVLTGGGVALVLRPFAFLVFVVGQRAIEFAQQIATRYQNRGAAGLLGRDVTQLLTRMGIRPDNIQQRVAETARAVAETLGHGATGLVAGLFSAVFIFIF